MTVLFADLVGFTGRSEAGDPEAVRDLQRAYFAAVAEEVERFGGTVEKYIGDAAMALFGAPQAHDDDAERALQTALAHPGSAYGAWMTGSRSASASTPARWSAGRAGPQPGEYSRQRRRGERGRAAAADGGAERDPGRRHDPPAQRGRLRLRPARADDAEGSQPSRSRRGSLERRLPERPRMHGGEASLVGRERELASLESALAEAREGRGLMRRAGRGAGDRKEPAGDRGPAAGRGQRVLTRRGRPRARTRRPSRITW